MRIVIYGASDDLIEIDGDLRQEFYVQADDEDDADYVALSNGVLVKVSYDGEWTLRVIEGAGSFRHYPWNETRPVGDELLDDVPDYSDAVVVEADRIDWVLVGSGLVTPRTSIRPQAAL